MLGSIPEMLKLIIGDSDFILINVDNLENIKETQKQAKKIYDSLQLNGSINVIKLDGFYPMYSNRYIERCCTESSFIILQNGNKSLLETGMSIINTYNKDKFYYRHGDIISPCDINGVKRNNKYNLENIEKYIENISGERFLLRGYSIHQK